MRQTNFLLPMSFKGPVTLLRTRETYEKRMKNNEIIFIRTKLQKPFKCQRVSTVHLAYLKRIQRVPRVCLSYKPYVRIRTKF